VPCKLFPSSSYFHNFNNSPGVALPLYLEKNNLGYCKENCKWATRKEQNRNTRNNCYETYEGKTQLVAEWAEEYSIHYDTLYSRLYKLYWSMGRALTTPAGKYSKRKEKRRNSKTI